MISYFAMSKAAGSSSAADIGERTQSCDHRLARMSIAIYIYETPVEGKLGSPASYGCIRMGSHDILDEPLSLLAPRPNGAGSWRSPDFRKRRPCPAVVGDA
jgi:hypothetical protein